MAKWRRGHKGRGLTAFEEMVGAYLEGREAAMAQAGGTTTAYKLTLQGTILITEPAMGRLRSECATVDDALLRLKRGESVVVAGGDMIALRARLQAAAVGE